MPSPFPGMDPWLESPDVFPDLHGTLITYLGDELNAKLPEPYFARAATRVWVEEQRREPDVSVFDRAEAAQGSGGTIAVLDAGWVAVLDSPQEEPFEENYIEIRSSGDARRVTAIEVLSLANKTAGSAGRAAYRQKQREFLEAVNERLPVVPVPLLASQAPVNVDLQPLLDRAYDNRRYSRQLRYDDPCDPPLTAEQHAWAEAILRDKGLKT
ncbi:MAG: DUF4058 family protein [Gemmataceae bacterium]